MNKYDVARLLPIIAAFAEGREIQCRNPDYTQDWSTINPDTTEFKFFHLLDYALEWRVKDNSEEIDESVYTPVKY